MIPNEEKGWHFLAVKELSALLHRITPKNKGDFYCLEQKINLNLMKKYVERKIFV